MTQIAKLITFIEEIFARSPSDRFEIKEFETGTPILLDKVNRVRIVIHVNRIIVSRYHEDDGSLQHEVEVLWESLTVEQRKRIIELVDVPDDLDQETEDTLTEILKGV